MLTDGLESAVFEVTVLPVDSQWLANAEHEAVQRIIVLLLDVFHGLLARFLLSFELWPIHLVRVLLLYLHLSIKISIIIENRNK